VRVTRHGGCRGAYGLHVGAMRGLARPNVGGRGAGRDVTRYRRGWRTQVGVALMLTGAVLAGCTAKDVIHEAAATTPELSAPAGAATVLAPVGAVPLAAATSAALYGSAPVVVLAGDGDADGQAGAASAAVALGAPMLLTPTSDAAPADASAVADEVTRLGPQAVLAVGRGAQDWAGRRQGGPRVVPAAPDGLAGLLKVDARDARVVDPATLTDAVGKLDRAKPELLTVAAPQPAPTAEAAATPSAPVGPVAEGVPDLPRSSPAEPLTGLVVLARSGSDQVAAAATARAAGVPVHVLRTPDPRGSADLVATLSAAPDVKVLALGGAFGTVDQLTHRLAVVRTGVQLPGGGQLAFPGRRMVALYGTPGTASLGSLGEQDLNGSIARVKDLVTQYQPYSDVPVVPAFEIITTVAAGQPGADGDYSNEVDIAKIRPYVDAAKAAGVYVVLDLQPGRTDFLTQAKRYEELLVQPHVGLALDPEWRLGPAQLHRVQIGSVKVDEINATSDWLAGVVRTHNLPQKVLMVHQFRTSMIVGRERLDTTHEELATLVHCDGFGTQDMKRGTWDVMRQNSPNVFWGWKNFIDEDRPMLTPQQTLTFSSDIVFVSYQ
jgi:hypothetical protein